MSRYGVIREVSYALRQALWDEFQLDGEIGTIVEQQEQIVFQNPTETARNQSNRLSIWLYQVTENEFVKNRPMTRVPPNGGPPNGRERMQFPPLALNLCYLITPFAPSGDSDHLLLGKTMQVLYDNAILFLRQPDAEVVEELRIVLCRLTLEELTRIWEALREPYRLSICYEVSVTHVDSARLPEHARVVEREAGFGPRSVEPAL